MISLLKSLIVKYSSVLCAIGTVGATMASNGCRMLWYQPEEPENIKKLVVAICMLVVILLGVARWFKKKY